MKPRYLSLVLFVLFLTNVITALFLVRRPPTSGYAEITFHNISADPIQSVWIQRLSTEVRERGIKQGEQKAVRFYVDERNPDHTCQVVVNFGGGQGQTCEVAINNGEKGTVYVYVDRLESDILKRSTL